MVMEKGRGAAAAAWGERTNERAAGGREREREIGESRNVVSFWGRNGNHKIVCSGEENQKIKLEKK